MIYHYSRRGDRAAHGHMPLRNGVCWFQDSTIVRGQKMRPSLLRLSAAQRLIYALVAAAFIWAVVLWAILA